MICVSCVKCVICVTGGYHHHGNPPSNMRMKKMERETDLSISPGGYVGSTTSVVGAEVVGVSLVGGVSEWVVGSVVTVVGGAVVTTVVNGDSVVPGVVGGGCVSVVTGGTGVVEGSLGSVGGADVGSLGRERSTCMYMYM